MMVAIMKGMDKSNSFRYISNLLSVVPFPGLVLAAVGLLGLNDAGAGIDLVGPGAADVVDVDFVDVRQFHFQSPLVILEYNRKC